MSLSCPASPAHGTAPGSSLGAEPELTSVPPEACCSDVPLPAAECWQPAAPEVGRWGSTPVARLQLKARFCGLAPLGGAERLSWAGACERLEVWKGSSRMSNVKNREKQVSRGARKLDFQHSPFLKFWTSDGGKSKMLESFILQLPLNFE